jgi:S-adenosylmethionine hydrolase
VSVQVAGKVVAFSPSGDLITDITAEQLRNAPRGDFVRVCCGPHETFGLFTEPYQQPHATFLAVISSQGTLELRVVGMSAQELLGVQLGEPVTVEW